MKFAGNAGHFWMNVATSGNLGAYNSSIYQEDISPGNSNVRYLGFTV